MHPIRGVLIGMLLLGAAQAAAAQQKQTPVDVSKLPIDLGKVQHDLRQAAATESDNHLLKFHYTVDVYGQRPQIEFFSKQDNLANGPVPYGAPTHRDMIDAVTPIEFRAPIMDFSALVRWLTDRANRK